MMQTKMFTFIRIKFVFLLALLTLEFVELQTSNFCFLFIWKMNTFPWILSHYCTAAPLNVNLSEPVIPEFGRRCSTGRNNSHTHTHTGSGIVWLTQNGEKNNLFFFFAFKNHKWINFSLHIWNTFISKYIHLARKLFCKLSVYTYTHTLYTVIYLARICPFIYPSNIVHDTVYHHDHTDTHRLVEFTPFCLSLSLNHHFEQT